MNKHDGGKLTKEQQREIMKSRGMTDEQIDEREKHLKKFFDQSEIEFNIKVKMKGRWIPYFMSALKCMEVYGNIGCSREVGIYADGDGDFRPKFEADIDYESKDPVRDNSGNVLYDAG